MDAEIQSLMRQAALGDAGAGARLRAKMTKMGLNAQGQVPNEFVGSDGYTDYDWDEVFGYADGEKGRPRAAGSGPKDTDAQPFGLRDVRRVIAYTEGENEGDSWLVVVELWDGRYGYVEAGCDYTGWG